MTLLDVSLDDKYRLEKGRIFLTGVQALVRLPLMQRQLDQAAGLNTAGYITGYRGSPLGSYDQELVREKDRLQANGILHQPGVNEDIAATACSGTQQAGLDKAGRHDGVFAIWYGKGPGVDRSGDAIRHGNLFGAAENGGVLMLIGDDHLCESSTTAHSSEYAMVDGLVPILNPAGVQDILTFGLYGIAMSRFSGSWVSLKCVHDTVESTVSMEVGPDLAPITWPKGKRAAGANISANEFRMGLQAMALWQERRIHEGRLPAAQAFVRANGLDRVVMDAPEARLGVIAAGKSYLDLIQALAELGIDGVRARSLGLRIYKPGLTWPLEPVSLKSAMAGLETVLVVEDKRPLIEDQVKTLLYGMANPPRIIGKRDRAGAPLLPSYGALTANDVARALGRELLAIQADAAIDAKLARLDALDERARQTQPVLSRPPYFCAGCPHSSSTVVPEGSKARAGIGCHFMATWMDRDTKQFTQMGGEGGSWIGEGPFSTHGHMFQNVGDGTFYHSGSLVVRAAVAAGANITFKILYNDAVAMTGGQKMEIGNLKVPQIAQLLAAEGVVETVVVTDEPRKYDKAVRWPANTTVRHRDDIDGVQRRLREVGGVTALIFDQTCAAEKRRRRKRREMPDPDERIVINTRVCEGCGDCGVQSNCVAIQPEATELGRKRRIDQSACNKDFSCIKGFCPSFVSIKGGRLKKSERLQHDLPLPPEPKIPPLEGTFGLLVTGIGGTGVITIAAILGMAAHLEGKGCAGLDMIGVAQKGGAVLSHLKIAATPEAIGSARLGAGGADLVLGCDRVVAASPAALAVMERGRTRALINLEAVLTGDFTRQPDFEFPASQLNALLNDVLGPKGWDGIEASDLARRLAGDAIGANLLLVGYAYQKGLIPLTSAAIEKAITLNGVQVEMNRNIFRWGRRAAADLEAVLAEAMPEPAKPAEKLTLDELIARRIADLTDYQDRRYATVYADFVEEIRRYESLWMPGRSEFSTAVAHNLFKLMAYKDEYEVARLYTDGGFRQQLAKEFEGEFRLEVHLAPPILARLDRRTGRPAKRRFGPWMQQLFRLLRHGRKLRGTSFDPFGYTTDRRLERELIAQYRREIRGLAQCLTPETYAKACEVARLPEQIRGFGPVKRARVEALEPRRTELLAAIEKCDPATRPALQAAE